MGQIFNLLFGKKKTQIGAIRLDAAISEFHEAQCDVTSNPVEDGADISDHVRLKPFSITIEGVISNTPLSFIEFGSFSSGLPIRINLFNTTDRAVDAYDELLKLRASRDPFTVVTGLKTYDNMIIQGLSVPRNATSGNRLQVTITLQQVEIAKSTVTGLTSANLKSNVSKLAQSAQNAGQKVAKVADESNPLNSNPASITDTSAAEDVFDSISGFF